MSVLNLGEFEDFSFNNILNPRTLTSKAVRSRGLSEARSFVRVSVFFFIKFVFISSVNSPPSTKLQLSKPLVVL